MSIGEILKDSIKYPLSDGKKILILGVIILFSEISGIATFLGTRNVALIGLLMIIGVLIDALAYGYLFRIIKSSLAGLAELPNFNSWFEMFIDGIKLLIVSTVYLIPALIMNLVGGVLDLIAILYFIIIIPILLIAICNMANTDGKLSAVFRFREIFNKIKNIGWANLIIWYIVTGILLLIMSFIGLIVTMIIAMLTSLIVGIVLFSLIIVPYLAIYLFRGVALFYMSK